MILGRRHGKNRFSIGKRNDRSFLAHEILLDDHTIAASPNSFSTMILSTAGNASSTVLQIITPLPAASPSAFTTTGPPCPPNIGDCFRAVFKDLVKGRGNDGTSSSSPWQRLCSLLSRPPSDCPKMRRPFSFEKIDNALWSADSPAQRLSDQSSLFGQTQGAHLNHWP